MNEKTTGAATEAAPQEQPEVLTPEQVEARKQRQKDALDRAHREATAHEDEGLRNNWDDALKEYQGKQEQVTIRLFGEQWPIASQPSAAFITFFVANCVEVRDGRQLLNVPDEHVARFVELLLGDKLGKAVLESDLPFRFITEVIMPDVFKRWNIPLAGAGTMSVPGPGGATPQTPGA